MNGTNIHMPSAFETVNRNATMEDNESARKDLSLPEMIEERDRIWDRIRALSGVLRSHNVTMKTGLVTLDGFPRDDIDVAQIRTIRVELIRLQNDYQAMMDRIEVGLHKHHADASDTDDDDEREKAESSSQSKPGTGTDNKSGPEGNSQDEAVPTSGTTETEIPFAKVDSVMPNSPAAVAGLEPDDEIVSFGSVDWTNHENLARIARVVQHNEGSTQYPIRVQILRSGEPKRLVLTPQSNWGGRGMLGCHIVPHS